MNVRRLLLLGVLTAAAAVSVLLVVLHEARPPADTSPPDTHAPAAPAAEPAPPEARLPLAAVPLVGVPEPVTRSAPAEGFAEPAAEEDDEAEEPSGTLLRGTARTARGVPVEPYDVLLQIAGRAPSSASSDGQGRFTFSIDGLAPGEEAAAVLQVRACGFALLERAVQLRGDTEQVVEVLLEAAADALTGRVLDEAGGPLAGVEVQARSRNVSASLETARTDAEGRYALRCARAADLLSLRFTHPACLERRLEPADVAGEWRDLVVTLERGGVLSGSVLDPWGRPAAGVRVRAVVVHPDSEAGARFEGSVVSGADGAFTLTGLPPGQLELRFWRPGAGPGTRAALTDWVVPTPGRAECGPFTLPAGSD